MIEDEFLASLIEVAADLEAEIKERARRSGELPRRIIRDMETVIRARAVADRFREHRADLARTTISLDWKTISIQCDDDAVLGRLFMFLFRLAEAERGPG